MRTAVCLQGVDTPEVFEQYVGQIDRLGYDALWLTDSSLHSRNCWSYLTLAARASAPTWSTPGSPCRNSRSEEPAIVRVSTGALIDDSLLRPFSPTVAIMR